MPLTERDRQRYGIDHFIGLGYQVLLVDVADIAMPRLVHNRRHYDRFADIAITVASDRAGLAQAVAALRGAAVVFCLVGSGFPDAENLPVLRAIVRGGRPFVIPYVNPSPAMHTQQRVPLFARLRRMHPMQSLIARTPIRLLGLRAADAVILGGRRSRVPMPLIGPKTRIIETHASDYDQFLAIRGRRLPTTDTAVYIDTYMAFHPDVDASGYGQPHPDDFYPALRRLFDRIERELGLRVVIAVHPRADYSDKPDVYGGRPMVARRTADLLAQCRLALGCHSTATNFAVLFGKPLMVVGTKALCGHRSMLGHLERAAATLGRGVNIIDDTGAVDLNAAMAVNRAAYDAYIADYIKRPGTPERFSWDLVIEALRAQGLLGPPA